MIRGGSLALLAATLTCTLGKPLDCRATGAPGPDTVTVQSGDLTLHALIWRPAGPGPFPAVLFNHGSYGRADSSIMEQPAVLGPVFARHGYLFLLLYRRGIGLSADQGVPDGDIMARAAEADGQEGRNRAQLELLETEELDEARAGLRFLRSLPEVDPHRVVVAGHSFGGSLTLLLAERDRTVGAVVVFGGSAYSWGLSPALRSRLLKAVDQITAPALFIHAANDYSTAPGEVLSEEMRRLGRPALLKIYPAVGRTQSEGHNFLLGNVSLWESDLFRFLESQSH